MPILRRFQASALTTALALMVGVAAGGTATRVDAATLRIASAFDPQTLDPHSLVLLYNTRITFSVYEGLVAHDERYKLAPALATDWRQLDALTWRFKLRPDVRFHDGSGFTADDAVFSIGRALAAPSQRAFLLKGVKAARKVDPLTIDLVLSEPDAVLPEKLVLVAMMSKAWSVTHGVERAQDFNARQETWATRHANGTGPYRLDAYEQDTRTVLKAHPQWWGRADPRNGNIDVVTFETIRSDATQLAALQSGEVDLVLDPPYQDVDHLRRDPALAITQIGDLGTEYLAFDQWHDALPGVPAGRDGARNPFKDLRVRRAVYHAINVDLIIQKVLRGLGTATGALLPPSVEGNLPELETRLRYDPVLARNLLAEAGYPDGFDVRLDCVNVAYREHVCQAAAAMLTQVGIRADLHSEPGTQFFSMLTQANISLAEFGWTATPDAWQSLNGLLHTWDKNGGGTFNGGRYSNPRLDQLIDGVRVETDPLHRRAMIGAALRIAADDLPYVPLYRRTLSWAMHKRVRVVMSPDDTINVRWVKIP